MREFKWGELEVGTRNQEAEAQEERERERRMWGAKGSDASGRCARCFRMTTLKACCELLKEIQKLDGPRLRSDTLYICLPAD